jgi:uncharacterized alpha-E superfamily protein
VLLDADNPRSLVYQLERLGDDLAALPLGADRPRRLPAELHVLETSTALQVADLGALASAEPDGGRPGLNELLGRVIDGLHNTADAITKVHFTHSLPQRGILTPADPAAARAVHQLLP